MSDNNLNVKKANQKDLHELYEKVLKEKHELEVSKMVIDRQNQKSKQRTIDLFGKMIDLKKAQKIILQQKKELEEKNAEIIKQRNALERTFHKFRQRTIELFGKMIDLKKAYNIINQQKHEIETQKRLLFEMNASKDKFFGILAHDLKNPIGGFIGLTEVMADCGNDLSPEELKKYSSLMHNSSKQLYHLLENLLQWARSQTGTIKINKEIIDVQAIIDSVLATVKMNADLKQITLIKNIAEDTKIYADSNTLKTVVRNLITNAIKFSPNNSIIKIDVENNSHVAILSISDQGIGIGSADIDKLFKIDSNPLTIGTSEEKGTGLGLILCKEFIELNGGKIKVESELNKGSVFTITIPLAHKNSDTK